MYNFIKVQHLETHPGIRSILHICLPLSWILGHVPMICPWFVHHSTNKAKANNTYGHTLYIYIMISNADLKLQNTCGLFLVQGCPRSIEVQKMTPSQLNGAPRRPAAKYLGSITSGGLPETAITSGHHVWEVHLSWYRTYFLADIGHLQYERTRHQKRSSNLYLLHVVLQHTKHANWQYPHQMME